MPFLLKPKCSCRASACGGFAAVERQAEPGAGIGSLGLLVVSVVRTLGLETLVFFVETHRWWNTFMKEWWEFIVKTNVCLKIIPLPCIRLLFSAALFVLWFPLPKVVVTPLASPHPSTASCPYVRHCPLCIHWWLRKGLYRPSMSFQSSGHGLETFSLIFPSESLTPISVCLKQVLNAMTPPWGRRFIVLVRTTHWPSTCIGQLVSDKAYK